MFKKLWMNQTQFVKYANFLLQSGLPRLPEKTWAPPKIFILGAMLIYTILGIGFLDWVSGRQESDLSSWWWGAINTGRFNFFLLRVNDTSTRKQENSGADIFFGVCGVAAFLHRKFFGMYCDAYPLMAAFSLWVPAKKFADLLTLDHTRDLESHQHALRWHQIEGDFIALKELSWIISEVCME